MTEQELRSAKAPFKVRSTRTPKRHVATVVGFSQNDPLGVGGGLLPDMPTVYFKGGGWLLVRDLLANYELVSKKRNRSSTTGESR